MKGVLGDGRREVHWDTKPAETGGVIHVVDNVVVSPRAVAVVPRAAGEEDAALLGEVSDLDVDVGLRSSPRVLSDGNPDASTFFCTFQKSYQKYLAKMPFGWLILNLLDDICI